MPSKKHRKQRKKINVKKQPSPPLNQDIMNEIAKYAAYKNSLSVFRQTSSSNNFFVENTDAGLRARLASNLQPSWFSSSIVSLCAYQQQACNGGAIIGALGSVYHNLYPLKSLSVSAIGTGTTAGVTGFIGSGLLSAISLEKNKHKVDEDSFSIITDNMMLGCLNWGFGFAAGCGASLFSAISGVMFDLPFGVNTSTCPAYLYHQLARNGLECTPGQIVLDTILKEVVGVSFKNACFFSAATAIARLGVLSNNEKVASARKEMVLIRESLDKPYCRA